MRLLEKGLWLSGFDAIAVKGMFELWLGKFV